MKLNSMLKYLDTKKKENKIQNESELALVPGKRNLQIKIFSPCQQQCGDLLYKGPFLIIIQFVRLFHEFSVTTNF